jgi:hypothetical protein
VGDVPERESITTDGAKGTLRVVPYQTMEHAIRGAVMELVSLADKSEKPRVEQEKGG